MSCLSLLGIGTSSMERAPIRPFAPSEPDLFFSKISLDILKPFQTSLMTLFSLLNLQPSTILRKFIEVMNQYNWDSS